MTTSLHIDANGNAVQSVQLAGTPAKITIGASTARVAIPSVGPDCRRYYHFYEKQRY